MRERWLALFLLTWASMAGAQVPDKAYDGTWFGRMACSEFLGPLAQSRRPGAFSDAFALNVLTRQGHAHFETAAEISEYKLHIAPDAVVTLEGGGLRKGDPKAIWKISARGRLIRGRIDASGPMLTGAGQTIRARCHFNLENFAVQARPEEQQTPPVAPDAQRAETSPRSRPTETALASKAQVEEQVSPPRAQSGSLSAPMARPVLPAKVVSSVDAPPNEMLLIDTPASVQEISDYLSTVKRYEGSNFEVCDSAMHKWRKFEFDAKGHRTPEWLSLFHRCEELVAQARNQRARDERAAQEARQRTAEQRQLDEGKATETKRESDEARLIADLKAGRAEPKGCWQFMVSKGAPDKMSSITKVSIRPPEGFGYFIGKIDQIDGKLLTVNFKRLSSIERLGVDSADLFFVRLVPDTQVYNESKIAIGSTVAGYGIQALTQTVKLTDGTGRAIAGIVAACIQGPG